jgi:hypothetical protein
MRGVCPLIRRFMVGPIRLMKRLNIRFSQAVADRCMPVSVIHMSPAGGQ